MTQLLSPRRPATEGSAHRPTRPLGVNAALAALASVGAGLVICWVVALTAWFASDGGAHGESTSALKVGSGAWLLAHGADLQLDTAVVTAVPLGLTALCAWIVYRAGRWAGATGEVDDLSSVGLATVVLAGVYGCLALGLALLTTTTRAAPDPLGAFVGGALLGAAGGGAGLAVGSGLRPELRALLPDHARAVLFGGIVAALSLWVGGALLAAAAIAVRGQSVADTLSRLQLDVAGGLFSLLLVALIAPNLATWGSSYLLGGGFALGTDTVVAPSGVVLGPVPAVPVLAATPEPGAAPGWVMGVLAVPVLCGMLAGWAVNRRFPTADHRWAVVRATGGGVVGALALTLVAAWSGGAIGGGRMRDVGPDLSTFLLMSTLALGVGAATAAGLMVWWRRRHGTTTDLAEGASRPERRLPWRDGEAAARRATDRRARRRATTWRQRGRAADDVPPWTRLGVWGASTPPAGSAPSPGNEPDDVHADGDRDGHGGEDTTHVTRG